MPAIASPRTNFEAPSMDSTQWVSQLASFSSVEQAMKTNEKLDQILKKSAGSDAGSLIGRAISTTDGQSLGVIASVTVEASGLIATLQDGSTLALDGTVVVS